jgi:hypothetical protein
MYYSIKITQIKSNQIRKNSKEKWKEKITIGKWIRTVEVDELRERERVMAC